MDETMITHNRSWPQHIITTSGLRRDYECPEVSDQELKEQFEDMAVSNPDSSDDDLEYLRAQYDVYRNLA